MRSRRLILPFVLIALLATACSSAEPAPPAADRAVGEDSATWDVEQAILRTVLIEDALADGLGRSAASCMIDTTLAATELELSDLEDIDLSAHTGSGLSRDLAAVLADSLVDCGPSLRAALIIDIPGALAIPGTHAVEAECVTNAYVDAWRDTYTDRFRDRRVAGEEPEAPNVDDRIVGIVAGCDAGGAVILGASNEGHLDTHALGTLEWECLEARITADEFMPAFPFPEEPGNALGRLGSGVRPDVAFCEAWVSGEDVPNGADADENFGEADDAIN